MMTSGRQKGKGNLEKLSHDEIHLRHHHIEECNPLTMEGEDFSTLPETAHLEYSNNTLDQKIRMYNIKKFYDI